MKIPLSRGLFATVDDDAGIEITGHKWQALNGYAGRRAGLRHLYMHRVIMGAPEGMQVDHANRDTLDNRRANLRLCSRAENQGNRQKQRGEMSSAYKGVSYDRPRHKWQACIKVGRRTVHLGRFDTQEAAARSYNKAAVEHFGNFACLNDITGQR